MVIHKDRVTDCTPGTDSKYGVCWSKIVRGNFKKYVPKEQVVFHFSKSMKCMILQCKGYIALMSQP